MKKIRKGEFGYIDHQKKKEILKTVTLFALAFAVFLVGFITTKTKANMLTVVAILGCLPACKSTVNMIMFLRSKGCTQQAYEKIKPHEEQLSVLYDLILTSYEKNFKIVSLSIHGNIICGYSDSDLCDTDKAEKHIKDYLAQNGYRDCSIKILKELSGYTQRMDSMKQLELPEENKQAEIAAVILAISL